MHEQVDLLFAKMATESEENRELLAKLMQSAREGNLCLCLEKKSQLPKELFETLLHQEGNRLYLKRNWECERLFLEHLQRLKNDTPSLVIPEEQVRAHLMHSKLNEEQKESVIKGLRHSLTLITGGPGTGKTFTAALMLSIFMACGGKRVAACAPTGKASANLRKHLKGSITIKTLHALVAGSFLPYDLVVVDEGSMIDANMFCKLFSRIKAGGRLVILGDEEQLPPVEIGNLFADLTLKEKCLVATLTKTLRAEIQAVIDLAKNIKEGKKVESLPLPPAQEIVRKVASHLFHEEEPQKMFEALSKFRTLVPIRKGPYGVETLNHKIYLEHQKMPLKKMFVPIMLLENNEKLGLYNGDCALLSDESVIFEEGRTLPKEVVGAFELAYILSVHKAQGSEYEEVMVLLPEGAAAFGREMLYTAVTRAKKGVQLFGDQEIIDEIIAKKGKRSSGLLSRGLNTLTVNHL